MSIRSQQVQISIPQRGVTRSPESIILPDFRERFPGAKQMREMIQWGGWKKTSIVPSEGSRD
jgi:hypothetical protein